MNKTVRKKLPWIIMAVLIAIGLGLATYLTILHVKVYKQTNYTTGSSVCSVSERLNCETVAENPYSVFMGVPVSVWGMFGNLLMLLGVAVGIRHPKSKPVHAYMFGFTGFAILISVILGYISITKITAICIFCFTTYLVNFLVMALLLYVMVREKTNPFSAAIDLLKWSMKKLQYSIPFVVVGLAGVIGLMVSYPKYWTFKNVKSEDLKRLAKGVDKKGHHWLGARTPILTITEFSDYECPFCAKKHQYIRKLISKYPEKIRLVHRNYPLDQSCNSLVPRPFHLSSCMKAKLALCAGIQGKFWEANDLLFANRTKRVSTYLLSQKLGLPFREMKECMASREMQEKLLKDVNYGIKRRFNSTPIFYANGKRFRSLRAIEPMLKDLEGKDKEGHHWIGAKHPLVTIHEYSDYQCGFCARFHKEVRALVAKHAGHVRLVHHHLPLDHQCNPAVKKPFHRKACLYSSYADCAGAQGKFWETNDYLFRHQKAPFTIENMTKELNLDLGKLQTCVKDPNTKALLTKASEQARDLGIQATPTFYIDGEEVSVKTLKNKVESMVRAKLHPKK